MKYKIEYKPETMVKLIYNNKKFLKNFFEKKFFKFFKKLLYYIYIEKYYNKYYENINKFKKSIFENKVSNLNKKPESFMTIKFLFNWGKNE